MIKADSQNAGRYVADIHSRIDFQQALLAGIGMAGLNVLMVENGEIKYVHDEEILHQCGYTGKDIAAGLPLTALVHPDDRQQMLDRYRSLLDGEAGATHYDVGVLFADGRRREYELSATIVPGSEPVQTVFICKDVTEHRRMEQALAASEQKYRTVFESANDGIFLHSIVERDGQADFILHDLNSRGCELWGHTRENILSGNFNLLAMNNPPGNFEEATRRNRLAAAGETQIFDWQFKRGDGQKIWGEVNLRRVHIGAEDFLLATMRDITERKQSEEALRASEERMRLFFAHQMVGMAITSPEKGWLQFNDRLCDMLGYTREELGRLSWPELTHPEDLAADMAQFERLLSGEIDSYMLEKRFVRKDGGIVHTNLGIDCVRRADRSVDYVLAVLEDITERKRMEQELREQKDFQQILLNALKEVGIQVMMVENGRINYILDRKTLNDCGYTEEEIDAGVALLDIIHPDDRAMVMDRHLRRLAGESVPSCYEQGIVSRHGERREFESSVAIVPGTNPMRIITVGKDITERKRAEEALQRSEQLMRSVIDATPDWIFIKDHEHRYQLVNRGYANALHIAPEDFIGKNDLELGFPEELVKGNPEKGIRGFWADDRLVMDSNETQIYPDDPATIDGVVHTFHTIKIPLRNAGGKSCGVLAFARDITERKQAANHLEEMRARLQTVMGVIPGMVWLKDAGGAYLSCNSAFERFFGASEAEMIGKTDYDFVDAGLADLSRRKDKEAIAAGCVCTNEESVIYADDGRQGLLETRRVPVFGPSGLVVGLLGVARDITEIHELQQRQTQYFAMAPGLFATVEHRADGSYAMPFVSDGVRDLFGLEPEDVMRDIGVLVARAHPDDIEMTFRKTEESERDQTPYHIEYRIIHPTKGVRWMEVRSMPQRLPDGSTRWMGFCHDITERKQMVEALIAREQQFRALAENTLDPIYRYDRDCRRIYVNPAVTRLSGKPEEELLGSKPSDGAILVSEQSKKLMTKICRVFDSGEIERLDIGYTSRTGEHNDYLMMLVPERDDSGAVVTVLGIARDITDIRNAERRTADFFANMPGFAYTVCLMPDGRISLPFASPGIEKLFGVRHEDVIDDVVAVLQASVHPDDAPRFWNAIAESARMLLPFQVEFRIRRPGQPERWVECRSMPKPQANGEVLSHGIMLDITERKNVQQRMELLERAINMSAETIFLIDEQLRFNYVNDTVCRSLGYSREELFAMGPGDIDPDMPLELMMEMMKNGTVGHSVNFETRHRAKDGRIYPVEIGGIHFEDGGAKFNLCVVRDITERKRMELMQQESAAQLSYQINLLNSVLESGTDVSVWALDRDYRYLMFNTRHRENAKRLRGMDIAVGMCVLDGIQRENLREFARQGFDHVLAGYNLSVEAREEFVQDGCLIYEYYEHHGSPIRNDAGEIVGLTLFTHNITERKRMQESLLEREREFRSLAENMPDNVARWDMEGRYLYINPVHERTLGVAASEVIGKTIPDTHEHIKAAIAQVIATGQAVDLMRQLVPVNGELQIHEVTLVPERDAAGHIVSVLGLGRNMTEFYRMQDAIVAREAEFRALVEQAPEPIFRYAADGRRIYVNAAAERISGLPSATLLGATSADGKIVSSGQGAAVVALIKRICETGESAEIEVESVVADGQRRYFHNRYAPEFDADGKVRSVLSINHDITARKLAERQLKEALEFSVGVINAIPDLLFEVDRKGRYLSIWAQNEELLATQKAMLLGNTINEMLSPEAAAITMAALREADEKGLSLGKTICLDLPHGTSWFELSVSKKSGGDSADAHFLVLSRDITERKLAEVALRASEALAQQRNELLQAIVESSPEIIVFALDTHYRYLSFNQKHKDVMQAIWGKEIAVGANMLDVIGDHPDRQSAQRGMDRALAGESFVLEEAYGALSRQYWQNYWSPIRSDAGKVVGLTCFVLNITERKKAEEAVRESAEKLRSLFELSPLGIALTDMQGRYVEFNESFRAICGYPADELMTLDYWTLTPRQYEMQEIAQLESLAKTGHYGPYEKEYCQKDGSLVPIQLVGTLITGKDGRQHIWSIVEDISERKRTEAELKERLDRIIELNEHLERTARDLEDQTVELEAQTVELKTSQEQIRQTEVWYRSILHSAPDGLLVVDERGLIILVNERLEEMFGYARGELQGHAVEMLVPQAVRKNHVRMRDGFLAGASAVRQAIPSKTLFGYRKDGSEFPIDVSLSKLPEVGSSGSAVCASVRDVSGRYAMEAAREAALVEAQRLAQLRSAFMAQMSHELRTPLNGILGYAQNLLQGEALGEKQTSGLRIIQNSGEHLLTLINGILDHAAIEADKFELVPGNIEVETFLGTLIGIIRIRAEQKNIGFSCEVDADLPAVVIGDAQRLRQVLLNLLANAVKFTNAGQVCLRVNYVERSRMRFTVQDSGTGIAEDQLENIFLPFEQVGEIRSRAGGNGLGLAICRKLVRLMGGDIRVDSRPGVGSTFSFEIGMEAVQSGAAKVNAAALSEQADTRPAQSIPLSVVPPVPELEILHKLVLRGSMRDVMRQCDQLAESNERYQPFVDQLRKLAKRFQVKALRALIEQYRNDKEHEQ